MTAIPTPGPGNLRYDLRDLHRAISNLWYSHRPVFTTRGRIERTSEQMDRAGFERGMRFATRTLTRDVESILSRKADQ